MPPIEHAEVQRSFTTTSTNSRTRATASADSKTLARSFTRSGWQRSVDPQIPTLQTAEGDPVVFVTMQFDVLDEQGAPGPP